MTVTDAWSTDYSFTATTTGPLRPGLTYTPSASFDVKSRRPGEQLAAVLQSQGGGLSFAPGQSPCQPGSLCLTEDSGIGSDASAGLGMSGSTAFAVQARPAFQLQLTPHPTYWVTAGTYVQGQVLDTDAISNTVQVGFPPGVTNLVATLNPDNTWTVSPGP